VDCQTAKAPLSMKLKSVGGKIEGCNRQYLQTILMR
jgi:hypothetical protein